MMTLQINVPDMACGACASSITKAITALDATATVDPDLKTKWVSITTQAEAEVVKAAIATAGYTVAE
jgi:copper chaperone